jgi:hypothetical protein
VGGAILVLGLKLLSKGFGLVALHALRVTGHA